MLRSRLSAITVCLVASLLVSSMSISIPQAHNSLLSQETTGLQIVDRFGGTPCDAMPFREWLVVLNGSRLEIRDREYEIVDDLDLPSFGIEVDVAESGAALVCLSPCGLAVIAIDVLGTPELVHHIDYGRWKYPQMGDGFFCVQVEELEEIHIFDIRGDTVEEGPILDGYNPSVDGEKIAWLSDYDAFVWQVFSAEEPVLLQDNPYDLDFYYVHVRNNLCLSYSFGYFGRFSLTDISLVDISAVGSGGSPAVVETLDLGFRNVMAWNDAYLYLAILDDIDGGLEFRLLIYNTTDPMFVTYVGEVSDLSSLNIEEYDVISSNLESFVCLGMNFLEWWSIEGLQPQLIRKEYFSGYVSDLAFAGGIYDPIVWNALDLPGELGQRQWGYPFSEANLYPIIGDIDDIGRNESQMFYINGRTPSVYYYPRMQEFFFFNRFWRSENIVYATLRDFAIFHDGHVYKLEVIPHLVISTYHYETVLERWDLSNLTGPEIVFSFNVYENEPLLDYGAIDNGFFLGLEYSDDGSKLHVIDLTSFEGYRINLTLSSQEYPKLIKTHQELIFILSNSAIYTYKREGNWSEKSDIELVSYLPLPSSNFIISEGRILASNNTHFFSLLIDSNGHLSIEDTLILPLLTPPFITHPFSTWYTYDPGDILVNPDNGLIYRAGGTLGVWVLELMEFSTTTSTTTTTTTLTTTIDFEVPDNSWLGFILGTSIGIAAVAIMAILVRKSRPN